MKLKRFLRGCYRLGPGTCLFISGVVIFALTGLILTFALSAKGKDQAEALAQAEGQFALPERQSESLPATEGDQGAVALEQTITPWPENSVEPEPLASPTPDVTLEKGSQCPEVTALQERLMDLGYLGLDEPTDYYGNATMYAVELFQRQHELQQDGIAGAVTQALLYSSDAKPYVMFEGAQGEDIEDFQQQLCELGYLEESQITGYFGTDTVNAVIKFQNRNHLDKDGKAGEQTLETLNSPDARVSYTRELEIEEEKKAAKKKAAEESIEHRIEEFIAVAKKQLGKPYILGDRGPDSYDCSGLVYYCLRQVDVYTRRLNARGLSRTSDWKKIEDFDDLERGDLIFFKSDSNSSVGHVGIYLGSGEMLDASSANGKVVRRSCRSSYWKRNFVCGRRPIS